ncbi:uncharacterized protein LOC142225444 [Haematobia irritans]|uniref:uncharacterized protein LOC142225444 n=1 Tax=Haematobia irritans TaxID=7368 RepID=UPI003F4F6FC0
MRPNIGQQQHSQHQTSQQYGTLDTNLLGASNSSHLLPPPPAAYVQQGLAPPVQQPPQSSTNSHHQQQQQHHHPQHPHSHHQHQIQPGNYHPHSHQHQGPSHVNHHPNMAPPHPPGPHMGWGPHAMNGSGGPYPNQPGGIPMGQNSHMNIQNNRGQFLPPGPPRHFGHHGPPPGGVGGSTHLPSQHPSQVQQQQHLHQQQLQHSLGPYVPQPPPSQQNLAGPGPGNGERMTMPPPNYAKLPPLSAVNQQRINECAGIPLISNASAHLTPGQRQRISRKQSHSPPGKNWSNMVASTSVSTSYAAAQYAAAHVQGAPLMINKQQKPGEYWQGQGLYKQRVTAGGSMAQQQQQIATPHPGSTANHQAAMQYPNKNDKLRTPLRYQNSAPAALSSSRSKENLEQQKLKAAAAAAASKENDNSNSSNGGDSSNSNETCLPRIIKPRKRRKKDRKPPNNLVNAVYLKMDANKLATLTAPMTSDKIHNNISTSSSTSSSMKAFKSSEDLLKCLQKFSQISNLHEERNRLESGSDDKINPSFNLTPNKSKMGTKQTCLGSDINHGICFCNDCDPLKSIWDYPLRRSLSDSSSSSTSGTGSLSETADLESPQEKEDPLAWTKSRAEIVGVIGSKRHNNKDLSFNNGGVLHSSKDPGTSELNSYAHDILGGINFSNDLFKSCANNNNNLINPLDVDTMATPLILNHPSPPSPLVLLPETAETLLTRSINEISQKLIETCCSTNESNELTLSSCNSLSSFSASSASSSSSSSANSSCGAGDFSNDSGIESAHINGGDDLVFNFDHLHIAAAANHGLGTNKNSCLNESSSGSLKSLLLSGNGGIHSSESSSPTAKFTATNFLTCPASKAAPILSPGGGSKKFTTAAPTLDSFLLDLNNNQIPSEHKIFETEQKSHHQQQQQQQQFNNLALQQSSAPPLNPLTNHQPPQLMVQQHDQQFFSNCFDLMWHQQQQAQKQKLGNNNEQLSVATSTSSNASNSSSSLASTITNHSTNASTASSLSSFMESVGPLKTVFSTIS